MQRINQQRESTQIKATIDKQELDSMSKTENKIKKIKEDMESYRSKIKDLQRELKKQKQGVSDD